MSRVEIVYPDADETAKSLLTGRLSHPQLVVLSFGH